MASTKYSVLAATGFWIGALVSAVAVAAEVDVKLSGANEVPAVNTAARGEGKIMVGDDGTISGAVTTMGMSATMAHIHMGEPGKNGRPVVSLEKKGDTFEVPAGTKLDAEQMKAFKAGELYINVHSTAHMGGEIRGQLK
jgi:hypothetical protein